MSDDIVTRLRANDCFEFPSCDDVKQEAADEIERLRENCNHWYRIAEALFEASSHDRYCHVSKTDECSCGLGRALALFIESDPLFGDDLVC